MTMTTTTMAWSSSMARRPSLEVDIVRVGITTTTGDIVIPMGVAFLVGDDDKDDGEGGAADLSSSNICSGSNREQQQ